IFELTAAIARRRGAHEAGVENYQRAVQLDPRNFFTLQQLGISYNLLRRYPEYLVTIDPALSIKPDAAETKAPHSLCLLDWKADTQTLHATIDEIRNQRPDAVKSVADLWFICALAERDKAAAEMALTALGDATFGDNQSQFGAGFGRGLIARMIKDEK